MAKKTKVSKFLTTNVLSFERSVQVSEGLMWGVKSSDSAARDTPVNHQLEPIQVVEKGVRGQTSSSLSSADAAKAGGSNIQTVDTSFIPLGCDALLMEFDIQILPSSAAPHAANNPDVVKNYKALSEAYADAGGYDALTSLYIWNIANGRFAWRNRYQSDDAVVVVQFDGVEIRFDPFLLSLDEPATIEELEAALLKGTREDLSDFIEAFSKGLSQYRYRFKMFWLGKMPATSEVFPSQEYLRDEKKEEGLARVLASLPASLNGKTIRQASMHSQKCGAALRHIDIWHGSAEHGAVSVNAYAGIQDTGEVLRPAAASKTAAKNFYKIRANLTETVIDELASGTITPDVHFFMANLVRGGVYGEKD